MGGRDSNPQRTASEAVVLPLNYPPMGTRWERADLNRRLHAYQAYALTGLSYIPMCGLSTHLDLSTII